MGMLMKTLLQRLAPLCLCATALTLTATSAFAGNGSLFSTDSGLFDAPTLAASHAGDNRRARPLLYTDAEPVKVKNPTRKENSDANTFLGSTAKPARGRFDERDLNCLAEAI